jgi:uncharacterized protein
MMSRGLILCWDDGRADAFREGLKWITRAANMGHLAAQHFLAAEYATGENVERNVAKAARWYQLAAKAGHPDAQYNLALMYWAGEGVRRNPRTAARWLHRAATNRDLFALRAITDAYQQGTLGMKKDPRKAAHWRKKYEAQK